MDRQSPSAPLHVPANGGNLPQNGTMHDPSFIEAIAKASLGARFHLKTMRWALSQGLDMLDEPPEPLRLRLIEDSLREEVATLSPSAEDFRVVFEDLRRRYREGDVLFKRRT